MAKVQKVCFTYNNYTEAGEAALIAYIESKAKFAVFGHEVAPTTGTPHLQGYINHLKQTRFTTLTKALPGCHFVNAKGSDQDNLNYCTKTDKDSYYSFGTPQKSGKRNDLLIACNLAKNSPTIRQLTDELPDMYVKYQKGLTALNEMYQPHRDPSNPPVVLWLWGKAGVGKTTFAFRNFPVDQIFIKDGTQWWDGYSHEKCIVVDDFDGLWPFRNFLRFIDRYPYQGQIKGGYVKINSPVIVINCEYPPSHFWTDNALAQVTRRINVVAEVPDDF